MDWNWRIYRVPGLGGRAWDGWHGFHALTMAPVQDEIVGTVNSIVAFAVGGKDAQLVRREFLQKSYESGTERLEPVAASALVDLATGEAYAKLAGGRAVKIKTPPPLR